jgi:hypothetical protein
MILIRDMDIKRRMRAFMPCFFKRQDMGVDLEDFYNLTFCANKYYLRQECRSAQKPG